MAQALWHPSDERIKNSEMSRFTNFLQLNHSQWPDLHQWSINNFEEFWYSLGKFAKMEWVKQAKTVYENPEPEKIWAGNWFPEAKLNYAEQVLPTNSEKTAIVAIKESGERYSLTRTQLREEVIRCQQGLKKLGIGPGDIVGAVLANSWEAIVLMLATTSLGGVWTSCSPDFGAKAILDRFENLGLKLLILPKEHQYNGKTFSTAKLRKELKSTLPQIPQLILDPEIPFPKTNAKLTFIARNFSDPLFILFSSGTTGKPKGIIHSIGGTLLQHWKELALHCDLKENSRLLYYTSCGWMMWNWMCSAMALNTCIYCYDGSPQYPEIDSFWQIIEKEQLTCIGTSPKFLARCAHQNQHPGKTHDLSSLRTILSSGAPLLPEQFSWVYREVKADLHLASISGGSDLISCFVLGNPNLPVYPGKIQVAGLGMAVSVWDQEGKTLDKRPGELVCHKPFVSMPIGFVNDPQNTRYRAAYFEHYSHQHVWHHGDYLEQSPEGFAIYGRSDASLNPGGIRIGSAELYRCVENLDDVYDSLAVSYQLRGEEIIVLFLKIAPTINKEAKIEEVRQSIKHQLSPRHVPAFCLTVPEIPYTTNGKKLELLIKKILKQGSRAGIELSSLSNPDSLPPYEAHAADLAKLQ